MSELLAKLAEERAPISVMMAEDAYPDIILDGTLSRGPDHGTWEAVTKLKDARYFFRTQAVERIEQEPPGPESRAIIWLKFV